MQENLNILQAICFYNSELLIEIMRERFKEDIVGQFNLVDYAEPDGGNRALHFAVLTGNIKIIDFVLKEMKADASTLTNNGLNVMHCAAQIDRGVLSLMMFS